MGSAAGWTPVAESGPGRGSAPAGWTPVSEAPPPSGLQRFAQSWWDNSVLKHPIDSAVGLVKSLVTFPDYHQLSQEEKDAIDAQTEKAFHDFMRTPESAGQFVAQGTNAATLAAATYGLAKGIGVVADKAAIAKRVLSNPEVIKEGVKVLPKGAQAVKFYETLQKAAQADPAVAVHPDAEALDGIAKGFRYKDYASAPPDAQQAIRRIVDAQKGGAPAPSSGYRPFVPLAPEARSATAAAPRVEPQPSIIPVARQLEAPAPVLVTPPPEPPPDTSFVRAVPAQYPQKIMPGMPPVEPSAAVPSSPAGTTVAEVPPASSESVPAVSSQPKTELESLLEKSLNNPRIAAQAKAELEDHLKMEAVKKTADIVDRNQTRRALKLGRFLQDYGFTDEHIHQMTPDDWLAVGKEAEVENPSAVTVQKTKDLLSMGREVAQ